MIYKKKMKRKDEGEEDEINSYLMILNFFDGVFISSWVSTGKLETQLQKSDSHSDRGY